ncbi:dihydrofolate reductase family protein [Microbacterium sp. ASV49]|uniref:Dihydrofolate reductase family protein n=1 Tax=Microbacterium candidum TaxID=3041922 RepID=A0ABT7N490_9MICO|nr:dihydrofolate reductase family protein [Microbacterium sp. ASV49]MDL9981530.1 dihydrofolate reductase family protein [Microbacterium sp. ASV49]
MPARFVYWMNVSLDLKIESAPGENGGGDWMRIDGPLHREFNERARAMSMDVQGRTIYEIMETYWPAARDNETLPDYLREYGVIWTEMPKVLVSRTRDTADYDTRVIGGDGDAIEKLRMLRATGEGDIGVGGASIATQLLRAGLLDELMLFTHPVVLGAGRPLFDPPDDGADAPPVELDLLEQRSYANGVTLHRYAVRGAQTA